MIIDLVVEDGTLPDGANTYASLNTITAYLAPRGAKEWAALTEDQQTIFAIQATDFLNGLPYRGVPVVGGRIMAWPQKGQRYADGTAVPENAVPVQVVYAQCELCAFAADGRFTFRTTREEAVGALTSQNVNGVASSFAAPESDVYKGVTGFSSVDKLLAPFLKKGGGISVVEIGRG